MRRIWGKSFISKVVLKHKDGCYKMMKGKIKESIRPAVSSLVDLDAILNTKLTPSLHKSAAVSWLAQEAWDKGRKRRSPQARVSSGPMDQPATVYPPYQSPSILRDQHIRNAVCAFSLHSNFVSLVSFHSSGIPVEASCFFPPLILFHQWPEQPRTWVHRAYQKHEG